METRFGQYNTPQGSLTLPRDITFDFSGLDPFEPNLDIYTVGTTQLFPVATQLNDGYNKFRYVEWGGTTVIGDLCGAQVSTNAHDDLDPVGTSVDPFGTGDASVAIGATVIAFAASLTFVANEYAGGTMRVETDTGIGSCYRILRNEGGSAATNRAFEIGLGGLQVALDATSDVALVKNKYKEIIQGAVTQTGLNVGVGLGVGANGSFGWICSNGPWAMLTAGTGVIGDPASNISTAAAVGPWAAVTTPLVGHFMDVPASPDGQHSLVDIQLDSM